MLIKNKMFITLPGNDGLPAFPQTMRTNCYFFTSFFYVLLIKNVLAHALFFAVHLLKKLQTVNYVFAKHYCQIVLFVWKNQLTFNLAAQFLECKRNQFIRIREAIRICCTSFWESLWIKVFVAFYLIYWKAANNKKVQSNGKYVQIANLHRQSTISQNKLTLLKSKNLEQTLKATFFCQNSCEEKMVAKNSGQWLWSKVLHNNVWRWRCDESGLCKWTE